MDYSVKTGKHVYSYKFDETRKLLHLTVKKNKKIVKRSRADLSDFVSGFFEVSPEKQNCSSLFIHAVSFVLGIVVLVTLVYCLIKKNELFSLNTRHLWFPCVWIYYSIECLRALKSDKQGLFYFNYADEDDDFEIIYTPETRQEALSFVTHLNAFCGRKINHSHPLAEHKFENCTAKLFENEIVMYNTNGSGVHAINYNDIQEKVAFQDDRYTVNNIVFGTLAGICFLAAFGLFIFSIVLPIHLAGQYQMGWDLLLASIAFIVVGCLPFAIGKWFTGFCHRRERYYFIADRSEDDWTNNFALTIGKNTADASDFIKTLEKLIQSSHLKQNTEKVESIIKEERHNGI